MEEGAVVSMAHESHNVALSSGSVIILVQAFRIMVGKEDCSRWLDMNTRPGIAATTLLQGKLTH